MSKHILLKISAASETKFSRNQPKFSLNDVHEQQFNEFIKCKQIYCFLAAIYIYIL